jgi:hypothetical protein
MSGITCPGDGSTGSLTKTQLRAPFTNSIIPTSVTRNTDGTLTQATINSRLTSLQTSGTMPRRPGDGTAGRGMAVLEGGVAVNSPNSPLTAYIGNENTFLTNIQSEYCHYKVRYTQALSQLITAITNGTTAETDTSSDNSLLNITIKLNQNLNDLTQMVNAIAIQRYTLSRQDGDAINSMNATLSARSEELQRQSVILKADSSAAELRKRMVDYTKEKNDSTTNLLTLYAVLNVIAIGALVIIARS